MKKLTLLIFFVFIVATLAAKDPAKIIKPKKNPNFVRYMSKFKKNYANKSSGSIDRAALRYTRRAKKLQEINNDPTLTYKVGSAPWDDLDSDDRNMRLTGLQHPDSSASDEVQGGRRMRRFYRTIDEMENDKLQATYRAMPVFNSYTTATLPATVDYTSKCMPVTNQQSCGSCWAFASTAVIECFNRIRYGVSAWANRLSNQFLIECVTTCNKCNGGWPRLAFQYLRTNFSSTCPTETVYPFTSANYFVNSTYSNTGIKACRNNTARVNLNYSKVFQFFPNGNETQLKLTLANYGPVAVSIHASSPMFNYKSGIYYNPNCPIATATKPQCDHSNNNHAVVVVGYTTINGTDVWIVRNSWGTTWGMNGYMYMARNRNNNCNVACYSMGVDF